MTGNSKKGGGIVVVVLLLLGISSLTIQLPTVSASQPYSTEWIDNTYNIVFTGDPTTIFEVGVAGVGIKVTERTVVKVQCTISRPKYISRKAREIPVRIQINDVAVEWEMYVNDERIKTSTAHLNMGGYEELHIATFKILAGGEIYALLEEPILKFRTGSREYSIQSSETTIYIPAPYTTDSITTVKLYPEFKMKEGFKLIVDYVFGSKTFQWDIREVSFDAGYSIDFQVGLLSTVTINTVPTNADVSIDGEYVGKSPVTVEITPGNHIVEVTKEHYLPVQKEITVSGSTTITIRLQPDWGLVNVYSEPSGADVYIDGQLVGTTPLKEFNLTIGTHEVRIVKEDYQEYVTQVEISPGSTKSITATLKPNWGTVQVRSEPSEAQVYVDNELVGTTPINDLKLKAGVHNIKIVKDGYKEFTKQVDVRPGATVLVEAKLEPEFGVLTIQTSPQGANVYIDNRYAGSAPITVELEPGTHEIRVVMEGYEEYIKQINIQPGVQNEIVVTLTKVNTQSREPASSSENTKEESTTTESNKEKVAYTSQQTENPKESGLGICGPGLFVMLALSVLGAKKIKRQ